MLDRLEVLAGSGAEPSNDAVLDLVVDLLAARGDRMRSSTRDACADLLLIIMRRASSEARGAAALRLAGLPTASPRLLVALAREAIDVAAPILQHGQNLVGSDLVRLVSEASPAHLRAVARRDGLSEAVTDLIVLRGDREAIVLSLLNRRARLSRSSLGALADKARSDPSLRGALIQRSDLPDVIIERLWPLLDIGDKARLVGAGWRFNRSEIGEVAREASATLGATVRQGALPRSVDTYGAFVQAGQVTMGDALAELVEAGRLAEAAQLIARAIRVEEGVALNLLYGIYDRGLAILARGAGLDEGAVTRLACARARLPSIPIGDVRRTLRTFAEVTESEARDILETLEAFWAAGVTEGGSSQSRRRLPRSA